MLYSVCVFKTLVLEPQKRSRSRRRCHFGPKHLEIGIPNWWLEIPISGLLTNTTMKIIEFQCLGWDRTNASLLTKRVRTILWPARRIQIISREPSYPGSVTLLRLLNDFSFKLFFNRQVIDFIQRKNTHTSYRIIDPFIIW